MPDVVDKATGQVTQVAANDLADKWKSGAVDLVKGSRYSVRLSDGSYGTVPAEQLGATLDAGGQVVHQDEAKAIGEAKRFYGLKGQAIAAGGGALTQGTLGLADQLMSKGALDTIQRAQEQHPYATMAGEAAGAIGLTAATGLGGAAEGAAGLGVRALGLGDSTMARIAARAAIQGVRGAAEGAQYGVSRAISDDAISDHKLTAEQMLSTVGSNVMWGGALGGAFGAGEGALGRVFGRAAPAIEEGKAGKGALDELLASKTASPEDLDAVAGKVLGVDAPAPGVGSKFRQWAEDKFSKASGAATGKDPETIKELVGGFGNADSEGYANRAALTSADETRDQAIRDVRTHGDSLEAASKDVREIWNSPIKRSYIDKAVADVDTATAAKASRDAVDKVMGTIDSMAKDPDSFGNTKLIRSQSKLLAETNVALDRAIKVGDKSEMYSLVDDMKKALGRDTDAAESILKGRGSSSALGLKQNQQLFETLRGAFADVRGSLEDEEAWGAMGAKQREVNAIYTKQIDASRRYNSALTTNLGSDPGNPFRDRYGVSPEKAASYVRGLLDPAKDLTHQAVKDYVGSTKALAETMRDAFDLPADKLASVTKLSASADAFNGTIDKAAKSLSVVNQFERLKDVASGNATAFISGAGFLAHGFGGGIAGMALGKIANVFTHPAETVMQMARLEKMARESEGRIGSAIRGFTNGAHRPAPTTDLGSFARKASNVNEILQKPEVIAQRIGANVSDLRQRAPKLADALTQVSLAGLALLRDKMPISPPGDPLDPKAKLPTPPANVREAWLRYYDAVQDPLSVVDNLRDGRLSPEGIEVLQTVYPSLYNRVREQIGQHIADGKMKDATHQQRIGLGMLLQIPTDPTLDPAYIAQRQAAFAQVAQQAGADEGPKRKAINITKGAPQTAVERIEAANSQQGGK